MKHSAQQRRVLETKGVTLLGHDEAGRPVVEAMTGIPQQLRRWAVKRDGDPIEIKGNVTPDELAIMKRIAHENPKGQE